MMAETYTIVFNSSTSDATKATDDISNLILTATNNCVEQIRMANKVYRAKEGYGIKGGTSSAKGELCIGLDDTYTISSMTVYAASYAHKSDTTSKKGFMVNDQTCLWEEGHRAEIRPYTFTFNSDMDSIYIAAGTTSNNRWYVQKIEFEATDPHPDKAMLEMQYAAMDFEPVSWFSADEPMEDALDFEVKGKNITGDISLSLKSGKNFTITPQTISPSGGDGSVSYSITMSAAPSYAITYTDSIIASAVGTDAETTTHKIPISLTIKPKSSGGFALDTTCMVIGDMPGDYYQYAQNTADSTLKNHLGAIICCGKRYRYGSGEKKTWDAFYYTDRDTNNNQVLDMYSNNVRYFNPEKPTASVAEFDIEHMLPKSWWGGDVNPAYCDLFHLVPADYSANRSKSNHAPGIPADSSFNNGSFVTGNGEAYGLERVFCPADEYKGDFARAYFYIATCYGDSLTWVETGEAGTAMTNEGWQEFQPWLRDLLVSWHRIDPVSEKEKARAIEVNKIQGNRNPFIDYPDLVEYIWGNKQGTNVDFAQLTQSYGDSYSEATALILPSTSLPSARKEMRNGHIVIIRGKNIYTIMGQEIR